MIFALDSIAEDAFYAPNSFAPSKERPGHAIHDIDQAGGRAVGATSDGQTRRVNGVTSDYDLAMQAIDQGVTLAAIVEKMGLGERLDKGALLSEGRLLAPIDHV